MSLTSLGTVGLLLGVSAAQVSTGTYVGDGAAGRKIGTPFAPQWVLVKGVHDGGSQPAAVLRTATMQGASKEISGGPIAFEKPDGVLALEATGFSVGSSPEVNTAGDTYYWAAFRVATRSWVGDSDAGREIDLGFRPAFVAVFAEAMAAPVFAVSAPDSGLTHVFHGAAVAVPDAFFPLTATGFRVTGAAEVNAAGVRYHCVAAPAAAGQLAVGSYVGTGAQRAAFYGLGVTPGLAIVSGETTNAVVAFAAQEAPSALTLGGAAPSSGFIALVDGGFELQGNGRVNSTGEEHVWVVWGSAGDAGVATPSALHVGCGCGAAAGGPWVLVLLGLAQRRRRLAITEHT